MAEPPDREQVFSALKRLSGTILSLCLLIAFVLIALAIAVYAFDPLLFHAVADSPRNPIADEAQVFESTTTAVGCVPNAAGNASVDGYQLLGARHLVITGNVTLPDASYVLTEPKVIEQSPDQFVFMIDTRKINGSKRGCPGLARYTAKIQLPYGTNNYELIVRHGENRTLHVIARS
jgi:hypothetical protein